MKLNSPLALAVSLGILAISNARAEGPCVSGSGSDPSLLPLQSGMVAVTCFSGPGGPVVDTSGFVVALVDVRNPPPDGSPGPNGRGLNWCASSYHNENGPAAHQWRAANLGQLFGVTLDGANPPNIYVTASTIYGRFPFGPGGGGAVYRLNGVNGNISNPVNLPNSAVNGPGLGNICFNSKYDQFFVSNFEDARIYRLGSGASSVLSTYDHATGVITSSGAPEAGDAPGFAPLGQRVWGVRVFQDRLYYSIWVEDRGRQNPTRANEIWCIRLNASGDFVAGTAVKVIDMPLRGTIGGADWSNPVSDIRFSPSGTMFVAERTLMGDTGNPNNTGGNAHGSRVMEFEFLGSWVLTSRQFKVGNYPGHGNSAGGLDVDTDGQVWQTGDALVFPPQSGISGRYPCLPVDPNATYVYGLQKTPASGNTSGDFGSTCSAWPPTHVSRTSYYVDLNRNATSGDKTEIGSVEIYKKSCCVQITNTSVECIGTNKTYWWQFCITNCWTYDIKYFSFLDLPAGVTLSEDIITLQTTLAPGQGTCLSLYLTNTENLTNLCFTVGAHTTNFLICCSVTNCLTLAPCCVWIFHDFANPIPGQPNRYTYTPAVIRNVSSTPMKYLFFVAQPDAPNNCFDFSPNVITFNPALQPGQTATALQKNPQTLKLTINPGCPKPYCFLASAHDSNLVNCCSSREYITHVNMPVDFPGGLDGSVFEAGSTIRVPVIIDGSIVHPKRAIGYWSSNEVARIGDPIDGQHDDWFVISNAVPGTYVLTAELIDELDAAWRTAPATIYVAEQPVAPPAPAPLLLNPAIAGGQASFSMQTEAGVTCSVEYTESLASPNWTLLQSIVGDGTVMTVTDSITNAPQRFYRVRVP